MERRNLQLFVLAYPVGHLVLLWALLLVYTAKAKVKRRRRYISWCWVSGCLSILDFNFGYHRVIGTYAEGGWLDIGWMMSSLIIGLAGIWQATNVQPLRIAAANAAPSPSSPPPG